MLKILILNTILAFHPVHVTLTSVDQVEGNDTLKLFFRMYYDDFLRDYRLFDPEFSYDNLSGGGSIPDERIVKYFNDRVRIYINRKLLSGKLVSKSNDGYEICLSLVYKSDIKPVRLKIKNQVSLRIYSDQENMVYLNVNSYQDALRLMRGHYTEKRSLR